MLRALFILPCTTTLSTLEVSCATSERAKLVSKETRHVATYSVQKHRILASTQFVEVYILASRLQAYGQLHQQPAANHMPFIYLVDHSSKRARVALATGTDLGKRTLVSSLGPPTSVSSSCFSRLRASLILKVSDFLCNTFFIVGFNSA